MTLAIVCQILSISLMKCGSYNSREKENIQGNLNTSLRVSKIVALLE